MADRIAVFMPSLAGGGAERVMANLVTGLVERGVEVDMVLARAEGVYLRDLPGEARIVDLGARRVITSLGPLMGYLKKARPRVLLSSQNHANVVALLARRLAGVDTRVVISEHTNLSRSARNAARLGDRLMPFFVKRFYPWSDEIVAVSRGVADSLSALTGLAPDRIRVIYNPVVTPRLLKDIEDAPGHGWLTGAGVAVVIGVGRLSPEKDFRTLIDAFAQARRERDIKLIILGEGDDRPALERRVERLGLAPHVDMPGFVANPMAWMARSSVFVLSSQWEGLSNVIIEALACGVPVVSTDCPSGPAEILDNGTYGELVAVGDVPALARAILGALDRPKDPEVLRERAGQFSVDRITREYMKVLLGAVE